MSSRLPSPRRARGPASPRASASAVFSARSWRIVRDRGESSASPNTACCATPCGDHRGDRRGERRGGECAVAAR
eukprot:4045884-Pleurochrysis_carterae.AAC.1